MIYFLQTSPQAQQVAADLNLIGTYLSSFSSTLLPIASAVLLFTISAWIIKRFLYTV